VVAIIGSGGEGGTFLDWSLHYLAGDAYVKYVLLDRLFENPPKIITQRILQNPIKDDGTSHRHHKSHPTERLIQSCLDQYSLMNDPNINIHSMYIVPSVESYANGRTYTDIVRDIAKMHHGMRLIHYIHPDFFLEDLAQRILTKIPDMTSSIEDIRDRVTAQYTEPNKRLHSENVYPLRIDHMFYNLDVEIHRIFEWLELTINQDKYKDWLVVYKQWQVAQNFCTPLQK
jgi:hypothetical protein